MNPGELMLKADQALRSARTLLDAGDADSACNRAYYAMFDAARSLLLARGHEGGRTHRGVLNAFSEAFVKPGELGKDLGRALKRAETLRYVADYDGDTLSAQDAADLLQEAERFVSALQATSQQAPSSPPV